MPTYTIELTDVEQKAMEHVSTDVDFWIQNAVHERARLAIDELAAEDVRTKLANGELVSGTVDEIVMGSALPNATARNDANMAVMMQALPAALQPTPAKVSGT